MSLRISVLRRPVGGLLFASALLAAAPAAFAASLAGRVVDVSGTRSLKAAEVTLVELSRRTRSDQDGRFRFTDVPAGRYTLQIRYSGAQPLDETVVLAADDALNREFKLSAGDDAQLETILVVGQRATLSSSLSRQRAADTVQSVLTRDAIGQFPDQNVAEAARRAPGINVLNDQGEGRFISVRGLDPGLNAASINGVRVPAPESDTRAVALDVIPAELIESIEIRKSLTPEMDADTLGATIEIKTTSALQRKKPYLGASVEGSYNELSGEWSPKLAFDFSRMLTERLGVAGGLSYYDRSFATDNVEMDGWDESDAGVAYADTVEYRDYDVERERSGATLALDYLASESTTLYVKTLYSRFTDQEYRRRLTFGFDEAPSAGDDTSASFASDDGTIGVERDIKDRFEAQEITSISAGGQSFLGAWVADYQLAWSMASEKEDGSLDPTSFKRDFEEPGELAVDFDYSNRNLPRYTIASGADAFNDPAEYGFDSVERTTLSLAEDEELSARFDLARDFATASGVYQLKFGGKLRQRDKSYNKQVDIYDGFDGDYTLADVAGRQSYSLYPLGPLPTPAARGFFNRNRAAFERNDLDSTFDSAVEDADVGEDIQAAYLQGRYDNGRWMAVGGVRFERTENELSGNSVELVEEGAIRNGVALEEDTVFVTPVSRDRSYDNLLPSLTLRLDATDDLVLRGAAYASLLRPSAGQIAPRFLVEESVDGDREGEFGNPELDPLRAWNYDIGAEWYFARNAVVQLGAFHKDIEDYIVYVQREDFTYNGITVGEATLPINGEQATVDGLEFNYQQALTMLPSPFDGLLLGFNYTFTDAQGEADGRSVPLPASSENVYNAVLGYEKGPLSLRLATTYRDGYLDELGGDPQEDRYVEDHQQLDFTAKYRVTPQLQLIADLINLTDEPYVAYQNGPQRSRLLQYEEYSYTAKLGLRATF